MTASSRRKYRSNFSPFRTIAYLLIGGITHTLTKSAVPYSAHDTAADGYNNVTNKIIKSDDKCGDGLILSTWPTDGDINTGDRVLGGFLYFGILAYMFLGVAIVCDHFMASIEVITSTQKEVVVRRQDGGKETISVPIWNQTVANLTLMAFGSSAPEILLSVVEMFAKEFEAGELGPGTIVGSAAYNLLVIPAICISVIPNGEVRRIKHLQVFVVTAAWSIFAYVWLYMIVAVISPSRIEVWEGVLTLCFFPVAVFHAYLAEREYLCYKKPKTKKQKEHQYQRTNSVEKNTRWSIVRESARYSFGGEESRLSYVTMLAELREKHPQNDMEVLKVMAQEHYINRGYKSRAFYRIQASRRMTGRGNIVRKSIYQALEQVNEVKTELATVDVSKETTQDEENPVHVYFDPGFYKVMEGCGEFNLRVVRQGDISFNTQVEYNTEGGTAKPGIDYVPKKGLLSFPPGVEYLSITIEIIDDDIFERDEYFYVRLSNPSDPAVLSEPYVATVLVLDDDHSGIFTFKENQYEMTESVGTFELIVERHGGARGKVLVPFWTENGSAVADIEYEPKQGELIFENNESE